MMEAFCLHLALGVTGLRTYSTLFLRIHVSGWSLRFCMKRVRLLLRNQELAKTSHDLRVQILSWGQEANILNMNE